MGNSGSNIVEREPKGASPKQKQQTAAASSSSLPRINATITTGPRAATKRNRLSRDSRREEKRVRERTKRNRTEEKQRKLQRVFSSGEGSKEDTR